MVLNITQSWVAVMMTMIINYTNSMENEKDINFTSSLGRSSGKSSQIVLNFLNGFVIIKKIISGLLKNSVTFIMFLKSNKFLNSTKSCS